jgi:hypothetical protein
MKWIVPKLTARWFVATDGAGRSPIRLLTVRASRFNNIIKILVFCTENQITLETSCLHLIKPATLTSMRSAFNGSFRVIYYWSSSCFYSVSLKQLILGTTTNINCHVFEYSEDEMGRVCSTDGEKKNAYRILVRKPEGKRPLGRPRRRWVWAEFSLL